MKSNHIDLEVRALQMSRRIWLLNRLREADGPIYDDLIRELKEATRVETESERFAGVRCVRAVRALLWLELAVTEPDESIWLTQKGWDQEQLSYAERVRDGRMAS